MVRPIWFALAKASRPSMSVAWMATFSMPGSSWVPVLPGATKTWVTRGVFGLPGQGVFTAAVANDQYFHRLARFCLSSLALRRQAASGKDPVLKRQGRHRRPWAVSDGNDACW